MLVIKNLVHKSIDSTSWRRLADKILGKKYDLSVVLTADQLISRLNRRYRGKNKTTNILAFPLATQIGEIFLNPAYAAREAKILGQPPALYLNYLFIHGLLHLKGYRHGSKMEAKEKEFKKFFESAHAQTNYHRIRRRHRGHQSRGRRGD